MKPTFALDFRDGQVTLLHRTSRGWSLVGSAQFGAPDFEEALAYLRSTAMGLSPRGITTKLILPGDQILYTDVEVASADPSRQRRLIRLALEGRTPYPVEDLAWDWSGTGPIVQVAVIAKETLAEAEAFAVEHRFNPVSWVAVPEAGAFQGEPFFGMTAAAPGILGDDKVERDAEPVVQVLHEPPKPEPGPAITEADFAPPVTDARDLPEEPEAAAEPAEAAGEEVTADIPSPSPEAGAAEAPLSEPVMEEAPKAEPVAAKPEAVNPEPLKAEPVKVEPLKAEAPGAPKPAEPKAAEPKPAEVKAAEVKPAKAPAPEAPMALDVVADPFVEDDLPPAPAAAISAALASRRAEAEARSIGGVSRPGTTPATPLGTAPGAATVAAVTGGLARPALAKAPKGETIAFPGKGKAKGKTAGVTSPTIPGMPRREKNVVPLPTAEGAEGASAAKPARPASPVLKGRPEIGGKPRYLGIALTVGLLILLAAVAVWSSFFMGTDESVAPTGSVTGDTNAASLSTPETAPGSADTATETATETAAAAPSGTTAALPEATPGATDQAASAETAAPDATGTETTGTETTAAQAAAPDAVTPDTVAQTPTTDVAAADPAAASPTAETTPAATAEPGTETAAAPTPTAEAPQTLVASLSAPQTPDAASGATGPSLAAADVPPGVTAPQALQPLVSGTDSQPTQPPAPPPYGTVYKFDENGRIIPTAEGIMTPEGVFLVAGKPARVPPSRPAELTVATPEAAPAASAALPATPGAIEPGAGLAPSADAAQADPATAPAADPLPPADPALAGKRPVARPAGLVAPDQQGAAETAASPEDLRLAALRPEARPQGLVAPEPAAEPAATPEAPQNNASLMASGAPLLTAPVTRSPRPPNRPTDLNRAVDDAVTAALDQPAQAAQPEGAVEEPELDDNSPAPSLPTNASVAKQATDKNALNTRKLALLAVFGTSSNRFAMVRQANGAVKKVKVGDALDGGRIAAITANAIQYQKGGRMLTLALPTG